MVPRKTLILGFCSLAVITAAVAGLLNRRGFSARDEPTSLEKIVARFVRNSIPNRVVQEPNPWKPTPDVLKEATRGVHGTLCRLPRT